ncbi:glycoside hydrolase family 3 N-terminal domain-containing protein [Variovorax sp. J2P1-59]|uniref:glycoside hydrolase family 3 N-terminal domain-containing protein n=1 Tax=Variovorax flavidus TaxID=3053501 RepID=UPI002575BC20|nr:glycoside hydrolase family 3 N-terminal domain-containing protein [Variovorax sp. J2P1-59]MDM0073838.1 glycoside hydrolase family 3 N-terminal domain-containing protein [Variovorax sp. J2P1-59]
MSVRRIPPLALGLLLACIAGCTTTVQQSVADARIESLIGRMTVEEKVGQLSLYAPAGVDIVANPQAAKQSLEQQMADIRAGRVTGLFNNEGLEGKRRAQEAAVKESRLGIPLIFGADIIHGFRTVFPVPLAEAASWEPALAERTARASAQEASADGFRWTFAPMVDIARDARWGRGVEGAGEDVYIGRQFAAARVRGFQGNDLSRADAMLATPKHFAGYGAAEGGLDYNTVDLSERTLREVYLPPFRSAIDAGALSIMSAFNEIGGIPSNANAALLTGVLRKEWRFQGFVVSDYTADEELIAHGFAADGREAARRAFLAGTDVSMQSGLYMKYLPGLVSAGEVPKSRLDDAVRRVLRVKAKLGLFDQPFRGLDKQDGPRFDAPAHQALAREAASRSIVLLKNDGDLLPLPRSGKKIALIGPFAGTTDLFGPWLVFPDQAPPVGIEEAMRSRLASPELLTVVRGSDVNAPIAGGIAAAVAAARDADIVVLSIGENEQMSGEARSRSDIEIPKAQQDLADAVVAAGKPVVVLLRNGRALALEGGVRQASAILVTWFLGSQTGPAIADVLYGDVNPSGRLPVSFPQTPGQVPYYYSHKRTGRPQLPDAPAQMYKARYLDATNDALYPFGYGMGYARIRYDALEVQSSGRMAWDGSLKIRARISNTGRREAEEVVQLYIGARSASVTRPVRELKGFRKVRIGAGESADVDFTLSRADLMFIGQDLKPTVESGPFDLWVGPSATQGLKSSFVLVPE